MGTRSSNLSARIAVACIVGVLVTLVGLAVGVYALNGDVGDDFPTIAYTGSTGTLDWTGPWVEMGESDGPSVGVVDVVASLRCSAGNCLRIGGEPADVEGRGVWREVDLAGASSVVLSFSYRRDVALSTGSVTVAVSGDGGGTWVDLAVYDFAGPSNEFTASFDISSYAGPNMQLRFLGTGSAVTGYLHFDDIIIIIAVVVPDVSPTSTTPTVTTTSTTTPSTTTTTTASTTTSATTTSTSTTTSTTTASTTTSATTTTTTSTSTSTTTPASTTTGSTTSTTTASTTKAPETIAVAGTPPTSAGGVVHSMRRFTPMKDLTVVFVTTVEVLGENALSGLVLGVLVGWLAILGIDRRSGDLIRGWRPWSPGARSSANEENSAS